VDFRARIAIAAIAFIAIAQLGDVLARAWTTAASMHATMLQKPFGVHVHEGDQDYDGDVLGIKGDGSQWLIAPERRNGDEPQAPTWVGAGDVLRKN
jgi:hypothetical protein